MFEMCRSDIFDTFYYLSVYRECANHCIMLPGYRLCLQVCNIHVYETKHNQAKQHAGVVFLIFVMLHNLKKLISNITVRRKSCKDLFPTVKQQVASLGCSMQNRPLVDPYLKMLLGSQALIYVYKRANVKQNLSTAVSVYLLIKYKIRNWINNSEFDAVYTYI